MSEIPSEIVAEPGQTTSEKSKSFPCQHPNCGKRFSKASNLAQHLLIHSGERPFICDICGRRFRQSGNLTKHIRSHENAHLRWNRTTSEKPYKCNYFACDKSFTAKSSLQIHINTAHNAQEEEEEDDSGSGDIKSPLIAPMDGSAVVMNPLALDLKQIANIEATSESQPEWPPKNKAKVKDGTRKQIIYECAHSSCKKMFNNEAELREHLLVMAPSLANENRYLRDSLAKLFSLVERWSAMYSGFRAETDSLINLHEIRAAISTNFVPPRFTQSTVAVSSSAASSSSGANTQSYASSSEVVVHTASESSSSSISKSGKERKNGRNRHSTESDEEDSNNGRNSAHNSSHGHSHGHSHSHRGRLQSSDDLDDSGNHLSLQTVCGILDGLKASPRIDEPQYPRPPSNTSSSSSSSSSHPHPQGIVVYPTMAHLQSYAYQPHHPLQMHYNPPMYSVPGPYPYPHHLPFSQGYPGPPPGYSMGINPNPAITAVENNSSNTASTSTSTSGSNSSLGSGSSIGQKRESGSANADGKSKKARKNGRDANNHSSRSNHEQDNRGLLSIMEASSDSNKDISSIESKSLASPPSSPSSHCSSGSSTPVDHQESYHRDNDADADTSEVKVKSKKSKRKRET